MPDLDLRRLRPQTKTVSVYTRHSAGCSKTGEPQWRRCGCAKYLYLLKEGTRKTISAKTRSWEKAEVKAQQIRDAWDPVKQKMRELEEQQKARLAEEMSIEVAVERWLRSISIDRYSFAFFIRSRAASVILFSAHPGFRRDPMT